MSLNFQEKAPYPFFLVRSSVQQTISASGVIVNFDRLSSGSLDPGADFTNNRYYAPVKGLYQFSATLAVGPISASAVDNLWWGFLVSSSGTNRYYHLGENFRTFADGSSVIARHHSVIVLLNTGDDVAVHTSGIGGTTVFDPPFQWFSGHLITAIA